MSKPMINQSNGHQIRNNPGESSYFLGGRNDYGRYMWNIKYYGFENDYEIEDAQRWVFGEHMPLKSKNPVNGNTRRGFENISELLGRPIESGTAGRSGGWLVIHTELSDEELSKVDAMVQSGLTALPELLKEEREFRASEEQAAIDQENTTRTEVLASDKVKQALALLKDYAGSDFTLTVKGIGVDHE